MAGRDTRAAAGCRTSRTDHVCAHGIMRALNRHVERVFDLSRKGPHWGRRTLIGHSGSSAFRLSTYAVSMSLVGFFGWHSHVTSMFFFIMHVI